MPNIRDSVLIETTRTHRARLVAAFLFGELEERRTVSDNVKRFIAGVVVAAVISAGCVGTALVLDFLDQQAQQREEQQR